MMVIVIVGNGARRGRSSTISLPLSSTRCGVTEMKSSNSNFFSCISRRFKAECLPPRPLDSMCPSLQVEGAYRVTVRRPLTHPPLPRAPLGPSTSCLFLANLIRIGGTHRKARNFSIRRATRPHTWQPGGTAPQLQGAEQMRKCSLDAHQLLFIDDTVISGHIKSSRSPLQWPPIGK